MKTKLYIFSIFLGLLILQISCADKKDPLSVSTHPEGWDKVQSANFHGKMVLESVANAQNCTSCHGENYEGGTTGVGCFNQGCHSIYPHSEGYADSLSENFHSIDIAENLQWDIIFCQTCHGQDFSGEGFNKKNCLNCHTAPNGPAACNTCHGGNKNDAPPKDLFGNTSTNNVGVGAHQAHLSDTTWTTAFQQECSLCHVEPSSFADAGHIDNTPLPAEINFGLAASDTGSSTPIWDHNSETCQNIYCHGSFKFDKDSSANSWAYTEQFIQGNALSLLWTAVGTGQDACGTCHGLPPQGHTSATTCNGCHPRVVDANFNIINKKLHINGRKEVF